MSGLHRAAIFLLSLGEKEAADVLKHIGAKEVQKLGQAMASLGSVSSPQANQVIDRFINELGDQTSLGVGADDYVRKVLVGALGEDKASGLIDRILLGRNTKGLEALKWMEPRSIADLVRNEHPQIIAIVLSHLDADQAAAVLEVLPERARADVVMRIATLEGIPPHALHELDDILERQFAGNQNLKSSSVGGVKVAANILNLMDSGAEATLMTRIREVDDNLGTRIQDLMFVFDNLGELDDKNIQRLLRDVATDKLGLALKGADPRVRDKILGNLSKRAAEMLREDMDARGPVRVADVESAQKEILGIARKLGDDGEIQLGSNREDFV
ncbi:flagellar motor switch protein FliG [Polycyclovorans algicola]|uniref:flagellar motor switch protein FliG n=1 Tax=Polycyclovorans algicola TaxID=616992 RepID=UPI0004A78707